MKAALGIAFGLNLIATAFCRDLLPESRLETLPASDSSLQQCYIFRTVPGVFYRVESTHDLTHWDSEEEIYGLGHEYTVAMREFTPPPVPEPGSPPATLPAPAKNVSLRIQRSSGTEGGTVVSWISLDYGGPVIRLFSQSMVSGWDQLPLFWDRYGDYYFFLAHQMQSVPPPAENPSLGPKDAAMFAELETSFPAMNQAVEESIARARNTPPPAPADPNSRKFWRVHCDWNLDTDQDGSPDWAEFEMAALATGGPAPPLRADAFNADTNGNGLPDGEELDLDGDGMPDAKDPNVDGGAGNGQDGVTVTWERPAGFRFAAFPISTPHEPDETVQYDDLSENGTVLFKTVDHVTHSPKSRILVDLELAPHPFPSSIAPLTEQKDDFQSSAIALFGDSILGKLTTDGPSPGSLSNEDSIWSPLAIAPAPAYTPYPFPGYHDSIWDDRGAFRVTANVHPNPNLLTTPAGVLPDSQDRGTQLQTRIERTGNVISGNGYWRRNSQNNTYGSRIPLPEGTAGRSATLIQIGNPTTGGEVNHSWTLAAGNTSLLISKENGAFVKSAVTYPNGEPPVGVTSQGWLATNREIWSYDRWMPLERVFGMAPPEKVLLHDILDTGLGVADLTYGGTVGSHLLMPIQMDATYDTIKKSADGSETPLVLTRGAGVDDFSIGVNEPDTSAEDSIWIMAPAGTGATCVTLKSPLSPQSPLTLSGLNVLKFGAFDDITLTEPEPTFTVRAADGWEAHSGVGVRIVTKRHQTESIGRPLMAKVMKRRTVKVTVYKIARKISAQGTPIPPDSEILPTEGQLENHLDNLFKPQINADFSVSIDPAEYAVQWDAEDSNGRKNGVLDNAENYNEHSSEQQTIYNSTPTGSDANIKIFLVSSEGGLSSKGDAYGMTSRGQKTCWILGSRVLKNQSCQFLMDTIGHEVGHVLVDYGHPDSKNEGDQGHAPLPGTSHIDRLMCSGDKSTSESRILVKGEWDEAEKWMKNEVDGNP